MARGMARVNSPGLTFVLLSSTTILGESVNDRSGSGRMAGKEVVTREVLAGRMLEPGYMNLGISSEYKLVCVIVPYWSEQRLFKRVG